MEAQPDTAEGWCCDGRTYSEHAEQDGHCCQPQGEGDRRDLPADGQEKARERLGQAGELNPGTRRTPEGLAAIAARPFVLGSARSRGCSSAR